MGRPKLTLAVALLMLALLATIMTYTGFLVVGIVAEYLGTSRFVAGLLLGGLFARFPWMSRGKFRIVGLVPTPLRRPLIATLLALCFVHLLSIGSAVPAVCAGLTLAFVLGFSGVKKFLLARVSSVFNVAAGRNVPVTDNMVIDGEFTERKD